MTIFLNDDLAPPDGDEQAEAMAYDALVFELSVLLMRLDGNDGDPHQLVWEGGPIPEPWGDVWQKYEPQAKEVLGAIGEGIAQAMVEALRHMLPSSPSIEREVSGEDSEALVLAIDAHLDGWKSATFGWQGDPDPAKYERNKQAAIQAHAAECLRRIRETLSACVTPCDGGKNG